MATTTKETRLTELKEEEARLEAEIFGPKKDPKSAAQDEKVLDDQEVVTPEEPSGDKEVSTDTSESKETVPKDTREPNSGEVETLRKQLADEKHRYNRYKGSTDKTIFDLRTTVERLNKSVASLKTELIEARKVSPVASSVDSVFTDEVVSILGEEAVDAIKKSVKAAEDKAASIERRIEEKEIEDLESAAEAQARDNQMYFMSNLERLVPDLHEMNKDKGFNDWLREPGSDGIERLQRLHKDQADLDYMRVAEFFLEYKKVAEKKSSRVKDVTDTVDAHTGPTGTRSSESNTSKDTAKEGYIKQSEIDQFNLDVSKGKYKYDSVAAEAFEAKIFKAMREDKLLFDQ